MADIGNPIFFSDLFDESVNEGLEGLVRQVGEVQNSLLAMLKEVKKEASSLGEALSGTSSVTKGDRDATAQYAAKVEELSKANKELSTSLKKVKDDLEALNKKKREAKGGDDALLTSYSSLQDLLNKTKVNLDELALSERARTQIAKNGQIANTSLGGSYNQLYAQYNLVKTALNSMTDSMRNSEQVGKVWEAEALRIMNTMKAMQEATGKHTLSVGDYTKAFNGLSISTQQVLRELPTLANSWSQFFIAISNNVPIFVDNLKRVKDETGSWMVAMKGVLTSVFSWQTALLVVLTILPKIAKAIHDKKKAAEEAAEETNKLATNAERLAEGEKAVFSEVTRSISKLQTLYKITQDTNRSWEDRIMVGKALKNEFSDELEGFSAEDIAMGKAKATIDALTNTLVANAEARAYLSEIEKLSIELYDLEQKKINELAKAKEAESKRDVALSQQRIAMARIEQDALAGRATSIDSERNLAKAGKEVEKWTKAIEEAKGGAVNFDAAMQDVENRIDDFRNRIKAKGVFGISDGGGAVKDEILKIPDYYNDALEAIINGMEDGMQKQLALLDLGWKKQSEKYNTFRVELLGMMQKANAEERREIEIQLSNLELLAISAQENYVKERKKLIDDMLSSYQKEAEEEEDYEEKARKVLETGLDVEKKLRDAAAYEAYESAIKNGENEVKAKKALNESLLDSEKVYWTDYLAQLREEGLLTIDEYNKIMEKLSKGGESESKGRRRRRRRFGGIAEAALAQTNLFGETDENGYRAIKEEYQDFVRSVDDALSISMDYMQEWMDKRIEMAEVAVEAAQKEREAAKTALDYEMEARANGYANNVELARKEYEDKLKLEKEAIAEKERLEKIQEKIDTATQLSSLVTATAELWSAHASIPIAGVALAIAATAAMWGSFLAAKAKASQLTKYGEGMSEYLDYGGSHASGNDIDFGADKNGRRRRVERGEMIGVINKRNVEKYGVDRISDIIASLNKGTFENKYGSVVESIVPEMNADLYHLAFAGLEREGTDLGRVEASLQTLVEQGETRVVTTPYGRIEYRGNNKRIIRNS